MNIENAQKTGEEIAKKYNPEGYSPFPFEKIQADCDDLNIFLTEKIDHNVSGAILFDENENSFNILVNKSKLKTRIYFTIAHELGHYFLHKEIIKSNHLIVDNDDSLDGPRILYRLDSAEKSKIETEANNFAASLIMPEKLVTKAWQKIDNIEECANIFKVSPSAMSIRLERLGLIKNE